MMKFQRESFRKIHPQMAPLMEMHYKEIIWKQDKIPLLVNFDRYCELEEMGILLCYTARSAGILKGYSLYMLGPALHFASTTYAMNDMIFIQPSDRGHGGQFTDWIEGDLRSLGADVIMYFSREGHDWSYALEPRGYDKVYSVWQKYLGE